MIKSTAVTIGGSLKTLKPAFASPNDRALHVDLTWTGRQFVPHRENLRMIIQKMTTKTSGRFELRARGVHFTLTAPKIDFYIRH